jgi:hypothetical protein
MQLSENETAFFRDLEERLFEPGVRRSRIEVDRLLSDDFVEIGSDGSLCSKGDIIAWMQTEPPSHRQLTDFRAIGLAVGVVLVTYRSTRTGNPDPHARHSLRSSIWKETGGHWRMVFHQGTLTPPA